jgi:uncharacterized protein YkwD
MLAKNNELRKEHKMLEHTKSEALTKAAQDHAWYMARRHDKDDEDFNHRGGNGAPGERAARYGYEGSIKENIARGYRSVEKAFIAWQESEDHKDAIYSQTIEVGFGYAVAKDGTTYWVAVYGKPKCSTELKSHQSQNTIHNLSLVKSPTSNR